MSMPVRLKRWKAGIRWQRKINKKQSKDMLMQVRLKRWKNANSENKRKEERCDSIVRLKRWNNMAKGSPKQVKQTIQGGLAVMKVSLLGSKWRDSIKGKATAASGDFKKVLHNMYIPRRRSRKISKKERLRMILREMYMWRRKGVVKLIVFDRYTRYCYGLPPLVRRPLPHLKSEQERERIQLE